MNKFLTTAFIFVGFCFAMLSWLMLDIGGGWPFAICTFLCFASCLAAVEVILSDLEGEEA
jgi:hypothetical protein